MVRQFTIIRPHNKYRYKALEWCGDDFYGGWYTRGFKSFSKRLTYIKLRIWFAICCRDDEFEFKE